MKPRVTITLSEWALNPTIYGMPDQATMIKAVAKMHGETEDTITKMVEDEMKEHQISWPIALSIVEDHLVN